MHTLLVLDLQETSGKQGSKHLIADQEGLDVVEDDVASADVRDGGDDLLYLSLHPCVESSAIHQHIT